MYGVLEVESGANNPLLVLTSAPGDDFYAHTTCV